MGTISLRLLIIITALAFIIPLVMLLMPVQHYFSFLPLFNGALTGPIGATIGGIATPLLLLAAILVFYLSWREYQQASLMQHDAREAEKEKRHAEATTRYILELFALFKQENDKLSSEEVEKVLGTIAESHKNYHEGQIPPLIFKSHLKYVLNTSAAGQHLHYMTRLLTQLIKVVRSKQDSLPPDDYDLLVSFLDGFNAAMAPKLRALLQLNNPCNVCDINPYDYFSGQDQVLALNSALESVGIKPYKV